MGITQQEDSEMKWSEVKPVYWHIANAAQAYNNCLNSGNSEWLIKWKYLITQLEDYLPSGAGFDSGTSIDIVSSDTKSLHLETSFHHMNDAGMYDGWTYHDITVIPDLLHEIVIKRVTGQNKNGIKEYISDSIYHHLTKMIKYDQNFNCVIVEEE